MAIYTTAKDTWQLSTERRLMGWQIQVSKWTGDEFDTLYDSYCIAESLFEATFNALALAGYPGDFIESQLAEWEITLPTDDE